MRISITNRIVFILLCCIFFFAACSNANVPAEDISRPVDSIAPDNTPSLVPSESKKANEPRYIELSPFRFRYDLLFSNEVVSTLAIVEEAEANKQNDEKILYIYLYEPTKDGAAIPFFEVEHRFQWDAFSLEISGEAFPLLSYIFLEDGAEGCFGYVCLPKSINANEAQLNYTGTIPVPEELTPEDETPGSAYPNHETTWLEGEFKNEFGTEAKAFTPKNAQEGVCLLVRTDDSLVAIDHASLKSNEEGRSEALVQSKSLISGVEKTSLDALSFTSDPNLASILFIYHVEYTYAYEYSGEVKGYSCVVTLEAYNMQTNKRIGTATFKNQPPLSISISPFQSNYYMNFPPTSFEPQMTALIDKIVPKG